MKQYIGIAKQILTTGRGHKNRTQIDTLRIFGAVIRHDMADGFPLLTTKQMAYKTAFAEMLGFIRGYDSAADFRALGCKVWDANANDPGKNNSNTWLTSPHRKGEDDIGRMYGVPARGWRTYVEIEPGIFKEGAPIDQLQHVVHLLADGIDDRRLVVTHLNPGEVDQGCLWPCHMFYKFNLTGGRLNMFLYMRSNDWPLGAPFNIAQYGLLLHLMARITDHTPGELMYVADDAHIYSNQLDGIEAQVLREPLPLPKILINPEIKTLQDLETWVTVDDFEIINYQHHDKIKYAMAV